jgi:putative DNA methylase
MHLDRRAWDFSVLDVDIPSDRRESFWCRRYGLVSFADLFTDRQKMVLSSFAEAIKDFGRTTTMDLEYRIAIECYLTCWLDKLADYNSSLCHWHTSGQKMSATYARQALPIVWDFVEINPFAGVLASASSMIQSICDVIDACRVCPSPMIVTRSSATELPYASNSLDAIVTDPPYYDNISYAKLSDYFYVWVRKVLGQVLPEHFSSASTPKKKEAVVDFARSNGDKRAAAEEYEGLMRKAFAEANRVLKPNGSMVCIYAHRTTLGWATLVESLRSAGFMISEAWPLDTEMKARIRAADNASLASSIFLVARKRVGGPTGRYEQEVQPELREIVRERVETLWNQGISGADLVIASVGAGLRAFTRFARIEYDNGEEVPAERFLTEVETVVLDTILARLSKEVGGNGGRTSLDGVDPATRFYTLWRYTYRGADLEAGEAIIFANGTHVELDGPNGLSSGARALIEKKKGKYRLRDYTERGNDEELGFPAEIGQPAPLIDALHRTLWLMENRPLKLAEFFKEIEVNRDQLRLVAQALSGPALKGGEMGDISPTGEMAALAKLTANWRSVVEDNAVTQAEQADRKHGQGKLFE